MAIVLGENQYGKAETRLVRVDRDADEHRLVDLNVSTALSGDLTETHLTGANDKVLATDTQKNTVLAFARDGVGQIETFGLRLARHYVGQLASIHRARVEIEQYPWTRLGPHSFTRSGEGTRLATVVFDGEATVEGGIKDLTVLNTTDSEFWGYPRDEYTTLPETKDRILATAVNARWRFSSTQVEWAEAYATARASLLDAFATTYSYSLQQTLFAMGKRVLENVPDIASVRLSLPNQHHYLTDLSPFDLDNPGVVFHVGDRPYGLIEAEVVRET
ncbi:factor-independent urate hydroxylase [Kibdelosporangium phytohabitans]|uniref:Uricase n=1 Tax=Kibdelosporangium phytohabitans TaxID=860235 RepID=A0A0N7F3K3_9PSEU|nr:urate oxidase [Kibdelosporangium phytohabitans]ALG08871.1 urate oxidase [Kibdelosporangium phytohabitans]MBE1469979.1 urate oxidase [Kibdelosporangium phytohabitans]